MDGVRNRKRQFYDDQGRYHVSRKIHALPAGAGCEQHRILHLLKPCNLFLGISPYLHHRKRDLVTQELLHTSHQGIRCEQYQRMPVSGTHQIADLSGKLLSLLPASLFHGLQVLRDIEQTVLFVAEWGFCHALPDTSFFFQPSHLSGPCKTVPGF